MALTLNDMIKALFDVKTRAYNHHVNVLHTEPTTEIVINNPNRLSFALSNTGSHNVFVSFERNFTVDQGIVLVPDGGFIGFNWDEDFDVVGWSMYGISEVGASNVSVVEIISV